MLGELFADRRRAARVRIDRGDAGRRRRRGVIEQAVGDPDAAFDGRGRGAVGRELMDGGLAEQASAQAVGGQGDFAHFDAADAGDAVMFREPLGEHREARLHQRTRGKVLGDQLAEEGGRLVGDALSE